MKIRPFVVNTIAACVVLGVLGYLLYAAVSNVRSVDVVAVPDELHPDGESEVVVEVRLLNALGSRAWSSRKARFRIAEGQESGAIVDSSALSARVRATFVPGVVVMRVYIEGIPLPYEVSIPVRRSYALDFSLPARPSHCLHIRTDIHSAA